MVAWGNGRRPRPDLCHRSPEPGKGQVVGRPHAGTPGFSPGIAGGTGPNVSPTRRAAAGYIASGSRGIEITPSPPPSGRHSTRSRSTHGNSPAGAGARWRMPRKSGWAGSRTTVRSCGRAVTDGTSSTADLPAPSRASPARGATRWSWGGSHPSGTRSSHPTATPSGTRISAAMWCEGTGPQPNRTSCSSRAPERELGAWITATPGGFHRPPTRAAPWPSNGGQRRSATRKPRTIVTVRAGGWLRSPAAVPRAVGHPATRPYTAHGRRPPICRVSA